jgi:hypothetical protein
LPAQLSTWYDRGRTSAATADWSHPRRDAHRHDAGSCDRRPTATRHPRPCRSRTGQLWCSRLNTTMRCCCRRKVLSQIYARKHAEDWASYTHPTARQRKRRSARTAAAPSNCLAAPNWSSLRASSGARLKRGACPFPLTPDFTSRRESNVDEPIRRARPDPRTHIREVGHTPARWPRHAVQRAETDESETPNPWNARSGEPKARRRTCAERAVRPAGIRNVRHENQFAERMSTNLG